MVKGVYTSDNLYSSETLPKGMELKLAKATPWTSVYNW